MTRIRPLSEREVRVLGALMEKEQATPEYYPMTVNAVLAACNQKSNRHPVTNLSEEEVSNTLEALRRDVLVWRGEGVRVPRWEHRLGSRLGLQPPHKAVVTLLFLRGAQTPGELRTRSERLAAFASVEEVEETLRALAAREDPIVRELPRQPGQRENRWIQLLGARSEAAEPEAAETDVESKASTAGHRESRLERVEAELAELRERVERLERRTDPEP